MSIDFDGCFNWLEKKSIFHNPSNHAPLLIRATPQPDGSLIEISGNVALMSRQNNFYCLNTVQLMAKVNTLMEELKLPQITETATVSRIHLVSSYETGSRHNLTAYLTHIAQIKTTRMSVTHIQDDFTHSVIHGTKSLYRTIAVYDKYLDIQKSKCKLSQHPYYLSLMDYLQRNGVFDIELILKKRFLAQHGLTELSSISTQTMTDLFQQASNSVAPLNPASSAELSNSALGAYHRWMFGYQFDKASLRTFYRHRQEILQKTGVDISLPYDPDKFIAPDQKTPIQVQPSDLTQTTCPFPTIPPSDNPPEIHF